MSPISSRKIVPPFASRNRPRRARPAPVNAPFSCPNSSASSRLGASALQSNATNGPSARGPMRWIVRASSSLPVPLSPTISTVASLRRDALDHLEQLAHQRALADHLAEAARAARPRRGAGAPRARARRAGSRDRPPSGSRPARPSCLSTSSAPERIARTANPTVGFELQITTTVSGATVRTRCTSASAPSSSPRRAPDRAAADRTPSRRAARAPRPAWSPPRHRGRRAQLARVATPSVSASATSTWRRTLPAMSTAAV